VKDFEAAYAAAAGFSFLVFVPPTFDVWSIPVWIA